jgi:hypothetical protein
MKPTGMKYSPLGSRPRTWQAAQIMSLRPLGRVRGLTMGALPPASAGAHPGPGHASQPMRFSATGMLPFGAWAVT